MTEMLSLSERMLRNESASNLRFLKEFLMPTPHEVRRQRGFRPIHYSHRHKLVAVLRALGRTRPEICKLTGFSPWHVSRVAGMEAARRDSTLVNAGLEQALIDMTVKRLVPPSAFTPKGDR
jgi:hypothetical protein